MHTTTFLLSAIATMALAGPIDSRKTPWKSVDTTTTCDSSSNQYIRAPDPDSTSLAEKICQNFIPCAFPTEGMMCTQVLEYTLNGPQTVTLSDVEVLSKGEVNIQENEWEPKFTVTPANQTQPSISDHFSGVMWTAGDCTGYFSQLLLESAPKGCMIADTGVGAGKLTVGGDGPLKGTVFAISFMESK